MSTTSVQAIIGRAMEYPENRALLFDNPEEALEGYDLAGKEAQSLKSLDREKFDGFANQLEERISKSGMRNIVPGASEFHYTIKLDGPLMRSLLGNKYFCLFLESVLITLGRA